MKSGICPKCGSGDVYSGAHIPLKKGPFGSNAIPVSLTSLAALDNYVCTGCGYVEQYVDEAGKRKEIAEEWVRVKPSESSDDQTAA